MNNFVIASGLFLIGLVSAFLSLEVDRSEIFWYAVITILAFVFGFIFVLRYSIEFQLQENVKVEE